MLATITTAVFLVLAAIAAVSDVATRRVSNRLVLVIATAGLLRQVLTLEPTAVLNGVAGMGVGLLLLLPAFAARWMGGGDVKLLAAMGAWLGAWNILVAGLLGIALGGVLAFAVAVFGGVVRQVVQHLYVAMLTRTSPVVPQRQKQLLVPLALPLVVGAVIVQLGVVA